MRFKIDENLPASSCDILREAGHDALTVLDQAMGGDPDPNIASVCSAEGRILLTLDTDFGNILAYPPANYPGLIVIRTQDQSKPTVLEFVRRITTAMESESPEGKLWIVEPHRIRERA
jgi:predicted nuclease of predicted toxin-antitoxin system